MQRHSSSHAARVGFFIFGESMKIRPTVRTLLIAIAVALILCPAFASDPVAADQHRARETSPDKVIKDFYAWYIRTIDAGTDPFKKGRPTLQKYVTARLIAQAERSDADYDTFLYSQDWDIAWADTAAVSDLRIKGLTATAIVTFDGNLKYPRLALTLLKQAGVWKIDRVRTAQL